MLREFWGKFRRLAAHLPFAERVAKMKDPAIRQRIIAEHGGSIDVSDNVPRGTRFTIELPA